MAPRRASSRDAEAVLAVVKETHTEETERSEVSRRLEFLRTGTSLPGDCDYNPEKLPPWLDKEKFERARGLFKKYFFSIFVGHLAGLLMIVHIPSVLSTLLASGKSSDLLSIYRRYVDTMLHIRKWYEGNVWDTQDAAHHSVLQVRRMHKKVADMLNSKKPNSAAHLWISQYDMAVTQFAFVGLLVLYNKKIGLLCSKEDLESLIHFWRGIGYLLGIDDRYNICAGTYEDTIRLYQFLMQTEFKPRLENPLGKSAKMGKEIVLTAGNLVYMLTWEAFMKFWCKIWNISCDVSLSLYTRICYWLMEITFSYLIYISVFRLFFNLLLHYAVRSAVKNKKRKEMKMQKLLLGG